VPEGHTIHRLARDLGEDLAGQALAVSSPQGRFVQASSLDGLVLLGARAVGKHLLLSFSGCHVHVHLGLFGRFRRRRAPIPEARGAVRLRLATKELAWDLSGPTACECLDDAEVRALEARLGADPLSTNRRPAQLWKSVHGSKRAIGALLLDQRLFAGIGNVYRAELLFLVGLHPDTPGELVDKPRFEQLWKLSRALMARGVEQNRIVTVEGATRRTKKADALHVYRRRHCRACESRVEVTLSAGRKLYHCPRCQPAG
jgi:endonuclease VIII